VIENVDILSPQLPEDFPGRRLPPGTDPEPGFLVAIEIIGADVTYRHSRVTLSRMGVVAGGSSLLQDIRLEGSLLWVESDARLQDCLFIISELLLYTIDIPTCQVHGGSPTIGPNNRFTWSSGAMIECRAGATPTIDGNFIGAPYGNALRIHDGARATVTGNFIGLLYGQRLLDVRSDAAPNSVFENNTFWGGFHFDPIVVEAPTDFGGGPGGSRGGNHFGPLTHRPGYPGLRLNVPGNDVHAADNFWRDGLPGSQMTIVPATRAITTPARVDPLTYADGQATYDTGGA
jgi:hypothetical protein